MKGRPPRPGLRSTRNRSSRRDSRSAGVDERMRAAANSMASGIPSRRLQIAVMATRSSSLGVKASSTATARSQNSTTPSVAGSSGGTTCTHSPGTPIASRLVVITVTVGQPVTTASTKRVTGASTCSQLSRISRRCRPRNHSTIGSSMVWPEVRGTDSVDATVARTPAFPTGASGTIHAPPGKSSASDHAISVARRVLPTPPAPVRVISRRIASSAVRSCSSLTRPTSFASCYGWEPVDVEADVALHGSQLGSGLEPELGQGRARPLVGAERFCLATTPVQRLHEQHPPPLPERLGLGRGFERRHELVMASTGQVGLGLRLDKAPVPLLEASRLRNGRWPVAEVLQGGSPPQPGGVGEGIGTVPPASGCGVLAALVQKTVEASGVHGVGRSTQDVTARPGLDGVPAERPA